MSKWKEYKLGDISEDVSYGYTESANENPVGPKFLRITDIREGSINWDKVPYCIINQKDFIKCKIEIGDIVIARTGATTGITETIKHNVNAVFASYLIRFRINKLKANPFYIGYILKSNFWKDYVSSIVGGSAQPGANAKQFSDFSLRIPSLPAQTAIAEILSSLDDKIELNNKINKELENLAQTLFKRWFIDFEFPNENGEPYKSSGGEMVESELGEIPKGWEVKTLKDEFILNMGQSPNGDTYNTIGDGMIFFQGRSDFGFRFPSIRMYTNDPKKIAKKFETLISVRAPVGDINMASEDCCIGRGLGSISHIFKLYSYTYYKILSIQVELKSYDNEGTVFGSINKETLGNIKSIIPPIDICKSFNDLSVANDGLIFNMVNECQQLTNLRDTLLPKLISGELEVNNINF
jgi:type I restriction enzyme S subunit